MTELQEMQNKTYFNSEDRNPYKNLVLHIQGGLGKVILATAVIRSYKLTYPKAKVVVVSGYPEVFINNPDVHRFYAFDTPYLWQDYYGNPEYYVCAQDPYSTEAWIKSYNIHLVDIWTDMLGVLSVQREPLLYFSSAEVDELQQMITTDKPLICVQSSGGFNPNQRSWTRNPSRTELDAYLGNFTQGYYIAHVCLPETPVLNNVHQRVENLSKRQAMCLMYYANLVIGIDSYAMHCRAANPSRGESVFFFPVAENVQRLGYEGANIKNLVPRPEVQKLIKDHSDYFSALSKQSIENRAENCPVPVGTVWFDI